MTTDYGSRKKKQDQMIPEWPTEVKFKPSDNKDITHAYEYIQGINSLITYYNSAKGDMQVYKKGTWIQQFQNFEKQVPPVTFQKNYDEKMANQTNKNSKGNSNQRNYEEKEDSEFFKQNKKHSNFVNSYIHQQAQYQKLKKQNLIHKKLSKLILKKTEAINNFQFIQNNDFLDSSTQNKLNIFDRKYFTMNKILEKVTGSNSKTRSTSKKTQNLRESNKTQQISTKQEEKQKKIEEFQQGMKDHKKNSIQINKKSNILNSQKNQKLQELPQKQRSESFQILQQQTQLREDNVFNYNLYFQKKYHNQGLRLDLSEKTKSQLVDFENRIKDYCHSIKI